MRTMRMMVTMVMAKMAITTMQLRRLRIENGQLFDCPISKRWCLHPYPNENDADANDNNVEGHADEVTYVHGHHQLASNDESDDDDDSEVKCAKNDGRDIGYDGGMLITIATPTIIAVTCMMLVLVLQLLLLLVLMVMIVTATTTTTTTTTAMMR